MTKITRYRHYDIHGDHIFCAMYTTRTQEITVY